MSADTRDRGRVSSPKTAPTTGAIAATLSESSTPTPMGHHRAVGHAGDVDTLAIDAMFGRQLIDEGADEPDVIDSLLHRVPTAVTGIPREQRSAARCTLGVHDDDPFRLGFHGEAGHRLRVPRVAATAVQHNDERHLATLARDARRHTHDVAAVASSVSEGLLRRAGLCGCGGLSAAPDDLEYAGDEQQRYARLGHHTEC